MEAEARHATFALQTKLRIRGWVAPFTATVKFLGRRGVPLPYGLIIKLIARHGITADVGVQRTA